MHRKFLGRALQELAAPEESHGALCVHGVRRPESPARGRVGASRCGADWRRLGATRGNLAKKWPRWESMGKAVGSSPEAPVCSRLRSISTARMLSGRPDEMPHMEGTAQEPDLARLTRRRIRKPFWDFYCRSGGAGAESWVVGTSRCPDTFTRSSELPRPRLDHIEGTGGHPVARGRTCVTFVILPGALVIASSLRKICRPGAGTKTPGHTSQSSFGVTHPSVVCPIPVFSWILITPLPRKQRMTWNPVARRLIARDRRCRHDRPAWTNVGATHASPVPRYFQPR